MIIKTSQGRGIEEAHFIYIATNPDQLREQLSEPAFKTLIIIEKLVEHSENFLIKAYVLGEELADYFVKMSIPSSVVKTGYKFSNTKYINASMF